MPKQSPSAPSALLGAPLDCLKVMAMVFMVVDHVNLVCFDDAVPWMFYVGRGSYPLFAFVMAFHLYRGAPLDRYLYRLVVFALLSQPVFVLAFHEDVLNILFTLALGAVVASWVVGQDPRRLNLLCWLALPALFFEDAIDFDLIGIIIPALFVSAMRGERRARTWSWIMLLLLNLDLGDLVRLEGQQLVPQAFSWAPVLTVAGTVVLPWLSYQLCRRVPGGRFLPRYALYWFYPGHLMLLVGWRLLAGELSIEMFSL